MYKICLQNLRGNKLELNPSNPVFSITEIQGLDAVEAVINTNSVAQLDGGRFNSSKVQMRSINLAFTINYDCPKNRIEVYKVVKPKEWVKLSYIGELRNLETDGYVQNVSFDYFAPKQQCTISILCPNPFLQDIKETISDVDNVVSIFNFPFAITATEPVPMSNIDTLANMTVVNEGDVACGAVFEIIARGVFSNPKIFNYVTGEYMSLNYSLQTGDSIFIDTTDGKKTIQLLRNGVLTNLFNSFVKGSKWLKLDCGENVFTYENTGLFTNMALKIVHKNQFLGV